MYFFMLLFISQTHHFVTLNFSRVLSKVSSGKERADLSQGLVEAFSRQKEIYHIHFFGREAEGCSDHFSDIDMVICSNDLVATKTKYQDVLASIAPIKATFHLEETLNSFSEMILLEGYSPYHKVDFTIGDSTKLNWPDSAPLLTVYDNQKQQRESQTKLKETEITQDIEYVLSNILFSVARFTKCLFRRDIDMYRRWESISNVTLVMLYENYFGWEYESRKRKLGSREIRELYRYLTPREIEQLHMIRPPHGKINLAYSYKACIDLFIELAKRKATYFHKNPNFHLINFVRGFMESEISRYQERQSEKP